MSNYKMHLHNLLTSNRKEDSSLPKSTSKLPEGRGALRKKVKSATIGENLLKEIQAMIISQEIKTNNKQKLASVGGSQAHRFLNDPKLNEHKIIGEKFKRKTFKSLAVDLY